MTARVLTGLEEALDGSKPGTFAKSIRLLSGVSGGSVGIMFYVNATYPVNPSEKDPAGRRKRIVRAAKDSSLDPTVFALVSYDLERFLFPIFVPNLFRDRGRALELALAVDTVRDHIQIGMAEGSFYAAAKRWELEAYNPARKTQLPEVKIQLFSVQFQSKESVTPLSWHLRESEKRDIDAAWETFAKDRSMSAIQKFFNSE